MISARCFLLAGAFPGMMFCDTRLAAQESANAAIVVGGRTIELPPPAGFVRCDGVDAEWDNFMTGFIPPSNRLLAAYGKPEDLAALKEGKHPDYSRNFNIQIARSLESQDIGERTFADFREDAKSELEKMRSDVDRKMKEVAAAGSEKLSEKFGVDAALAVTSATFLGLFEDSGSSLGFTMATKFDAKLKDQIVDQSKCVVGVIMAPVNGRLLNFYSTVPYASESDRSAAEKSVASWRDAVVAANPRIAGPSGKSSIFDGALRAAVIGGAIGAVVGLVNMIVKRRRAAAAK